MSAIKISARILAAAVTALGFVASCGQLLGDLSIEDMPVIAPILPDAGSDDAIICTPGLTECDGRLLQLCSNEGREWATLEVCATAELCESSDVSTVSACIPPACAAEQMSCDGNLLRLCNSSRTGWEAFDTCESPAHCDAGRRQCLPAPCEPGDRRCNVGSLERCNDDRTAWEALDSCETNELCEATLAPPATTGELLSSSGLPAPAADAQGPRECLEPICIPREVQCDGTRLMACNEGRTAFELAEECATTELCDASIAYTGLRGSPRCVRPTCAPGEHRCTEFGVLEVCNAARNGYDPIEACIGPPFCNAVAADNGGPGCEDAPCEAGEQQCNGAQIQACTADRTGFDTVGAPCETRGLCNDDNPQGAFCQAPACQRGPFSGSEFRCQGTTLLRCNDQHTGYDPINTCVTPALCNAGLGFNGCVPPACAPGETRCNGNFVQRCNADRTGFENIEQCAAGTCDSALGRCADPCVLGEARCNAQGNLEECRNLLVGREVTARCGSPQLCDAAGRTCRTPPAGCTADGVRRCRQQGASSVLEVCTDGRSRFATLDTCAPGEVCDANDTTCDACVQGSEPVCEGNTLVSCSADGKNENRALCANGCQTVANGPDRCRNCVPGSSSCQGVQLLVCVQGNGDELLRRDDCDTPALCQATLATCADGECTCRESVCEVGQRQCNGAQPEVCNAGRTGYVPDGPSCGLAGNCDTSTGRCFACNVGDVACRDGVLFGCGQDRSGFTVRLDTQRCVSDVQGERSQSCDGSRLVDARCAGATPECVEGVGCQECDPTGFELECASPSSQTVCIGGSIEERACAGAGECVDAVCSPGTGTCDTTSAPPGRACTRANGLQGFCDGLVQDPSCVECVSDTNCVDDNPCTDDLCSIQGVCQHPPRSGLACPGGTCAGTICAECVEDGDCNDQNACTTDACVGNACVHTAATGTCTRNNGDAGFCSNSSCVQCLQASDCGDDGNQCTAFTCTPAGACRNDPLDDVACTASGAPGTCNGATCVPNQVCTPNAVSCVGNVLTSCNAAGTVLSEQACGGATPVCTTAGCVQCVVDGDCGGAQVCEGNACVAPAPECDEAEDCGDDPNVCVTRTCPTSGNQCIVGTRTSGPCAGGGTCNASGECVLPSSGGAGGAGGDGNTAGAGGSTAAAGAGGQDNGTAGTGAGGAAGDGAAGDDAAGNGG